MKVSVQSIGRILTFLLVVGVYCFDGNEEMIRYEYVIFCLFLAFMMFHLFSKKMLMVEYFVAFMPFLTVSFLSCMWSVDSSTSLARFSTLFLNYIVFGMLWVYIIDFQDEEFVLKSIAMAGGIFSVYIIMTYGGFASFFSTMQNATVTTRLGGEVAHISRIGQSLSLATVVSLNLALSKDKFSKAIPYIVIITLDVITVLATQSRTSLATVLFGAALSFLLYTKSVRVRRWLPQIVVVVVVIFVILQEVDLSSVLGRWDGLLNSVLGSGGDSSSTTRLEMIKVGFQKFLEKPIGGWGLETSAIITSFGMFLHNNYVELLVSIGAIGFISYYYVYIKYTKKLITTGNRNYLENTALVLLAMQLFMMMGTVSYYIKYQNLIFVLCMTVTRNINNDKELTINNQD